MNMPPIRVLCKDAVELEVEDCQDDWWGVSNV